MPPSETDEVHYNPKTIKQLIKYCESENIKPKKLLAFIGPEGDFTTAEKTTLCEAGRYR
jgi:16S rRNA U1498 N3-methylase RsmE